MYLSIGVTGHRDLLEAETPGLESQVRAFFQSLAKRFPRLELQLLCPMAEGGDQLAARIALELGIGLVAVLPMARDEYEQDFRSPASLQEFRDLLASARQVICLPGAPGSETVDFGGSVASRDRQYAQAGLFISDHCQILLAIWDGKTHEAVGGTAQVVRYHLTAVIEGFEAQQSSAHLLADSENDLAYHIACSRDRSDGAPQPGLRPMQSYWLTSQSGRTPVGQMPGEYALMLDRLQQFEADRSRHAASQHLGRTLLTGISPGLEVPESARFTERLFLVADCLAIHFQKRVNRSLYAIHALALLMGLVFILYTEYNLAKYVLWIFLALFFVGMGLHFASRRREWHRKYLDYRALAEALRVQFYWNLAGVVETRSVAFAYENFLQKQDVELGWIRHVMRAASTQRARGIDPDPRWVPWVIDHWVGDAGGNHGQLAYYADKELHNSVSYRRTEFLGAACLWAGIGVAIILATAIDYLDTAQQNFLLVLMGILPLTAGMRDAISHKRAEKELIKQYRFMARIFANARRILGSAGTVPFQRRVLKALGEAALEEGAEWILMHRSRPLEHKGLG
ncbi:MAG TPA: hypothetical protein VI566_09415 [Xanthomonadales bacterium]|nr:hypothetical protein [Xanthomonadales bacterium]